MVLLALSRGITQRLEVALSLGVTPSLEVTPSLKVDTKSWVVMMDDQLLSFSIYQQPRSKDERQVLRDKSLSMKCFSLHKFVSSPFKSCTTLHGIGVYTIIPLEIKIDHMREESCRAPPPCRIVIQQVMKQHLTRMSSDCGKFKIGGNLVFSEVFKNGLLRNLQIKTLSPWQSLQTKIYHLCHHRGQFIYSYLFTQLGWYQLLQSVRVSLGDSKHRESNTTHITIHSMLINNNQVIAFASIYSMIILHVGINNRHLNQSSQA